VARDTGSPRTPLLAYLTLRPLCRPASFVSQPHCRRRQSLYRRMLERRQRRGSRSGRLSFEGVTMSQAPPIGDRPALDEPLLSPQELADYLAIPVATVYQWRHRGDGPRGFRVGKHVGSTIITATVVSWAARRPPRWPMPSPIATLAAGHRRTVEDAAGAGPRPGKGPQPVQGPPTGTALRVWQRAISGAATLRPFPLRWTTMRAPAPAGRTTPARSDRLRPKQHSPLSEPRLSAPKSPLPVHRGGAEARRTAHS
jgi:hypothetical protein